MKKLALALILCSFCTVYADPGIMIDIDIILDHPTGTGQPVMG